MEFVLEGSREPLKVTERAVKPAPGVTAPEESELVSAHSLPHSIHYLGKAGPWIQIRPDL